MLGRRELYALDIVQSSELINLINSILIFTKSEITFPRLKQDVDIDTPPAFIYQESRGPQNKLATMQYTLGGGSIVQVIGFGERNIIDFNLTKHIDKKEIGEVLVAFSNLDFLLDIFILHDFGVYSSKVGYSVIKEKLYKIGKPFHTTENKIDYLLLKKSISKDTAVTIKKFKQIRNSLAHQYLPKDDWGINPKDKKLGDDLTDVIEIIANNAWVSLLIDYNKIQFEVLSYFKDKAQQ